MAVQTCIVLGFVCFAAFLTQGYGDYSIFSCPDRPETWSIDESFDCPRYDWGYNFDPNAEYCCNPGQIGQYCCTYDDYYNVIYLSAGAIVGIVIGSLVFLGLVIAGIVLCCVCCIRSASSPAPSKPVAVHTVNMPQQPASVTVQAPPNYYPPSISYAGQQQQQQQQFQPAQPQPVPGENQGFEKEQNFA